RIGDRGEAHEPGAEQIDLVLDARDSGDRLPGGRELSEPFGPAGAEAQGPAEADQRGGVAAPAGESGRRQQLQGLLDGGRQPGVERESGAGLDVVDGAGAHMQVRGCGDDGTGAERRSHAGPGPGECPGSQPLTATGTGPSLTGTGPQRTGAGS